LEHCVIQEGALFLLMLETKRALIMLLVILNDRDFSFIKVLRIFLHMDKKGLALSRYGKMVLHPAQFPNAMITFHLGWSSIKRKLMCQKSL
jgi:hypothetical protein